jgi:hypothetical protein
MWRHEASKRWPELQPELRRHQFRLAELWICVCHPRLPRLAAPKSNEGGGRIAALGSSAAFLMKRFIITVLIATVLHAVACIIAPPFEFGHNRAECFFFAFVSGLMVFPIMFAILLLPLRAGMRRFMPASRPHTHVIVAFIALMAVRAAFALPRQLSGVPARPHMHGYLANWIFWSVFIAVIAIAFFWPFGTQSRSSRL